MSKALWWVMKGLAAAPPGITCNIGVSTSMKSWLSMKRRIEDMAAVRALKVRRVSSFMIRST